MNLDINIDFEAWCEAHLSASLSLPPCCPSSQDGATAAALLGVVGRVHLVLEAVHEVAVGFALRLVDHFRHGHDAHAVALRARKGTCHREEDAPSSWWTV